MKITEAQETARMLKVAELIKKITTASRAGVDSEGPLTLSIDEIHILYVLLKELELRQNGHYYNSP